MFDSLILLKQGELIYQGTLPTNCAHTKQFFPEQGFCFPNTTPSAPDRSSWGGEASKGLMPIYALGWVVETITITASNSKISGVQHGFGAAYNK